MIRINSMKIHLSFLTRLSKEKFVFVQIMTIGMMQKQEQTKSLYCLTSKNQMTKRGNKLNYLEIHYQCDIRDSIRLFCEVSEIKQAFQLDYSMGQCEAQSFPQDELRSHHNQTQRDG